MQIVVKITQVFILLTGLVFFLYGIAFTLFPEEIYVWVADAALISSSAIVDTRATYGGMSLAAGLFILVNLPRRTRYFLLLEFIILMLGLMALTRFIGIVIDGKTNSLMHYYLALEVGGTLIAILLRGYLLGERT